MNSFYPNFMFFVIFDFSTRDRGIFSFNFNLQFSFYFYCSLTIKNLILNHDFYVAVLLVQRYEPWFFVHTFFYIFYLSLNVNFNISKLILYLVQDKVIYPLYRGGLTQTFKSHEVTTQNKHSWIIQLLVLYGNRTCDTLEKCGLYHSTIRL